MSTHAYVSLHNLTADSIPARPAFEHKDGAVSVQLDDGSQLHFTTLADMHAFGQKLVAMSLGQVLA